MNTTQQMSRQAAKNSKWGGGMSTQPPHITGSFGQRPSGASLRLLEAGMQVGELPTRGVQP